MPIDRRHVIGHDEVPDPDGTGVGGSHHHTDPGKRWNVEALSRPREQRTDPARGARRPAGERPARRRGDGGDAVVPGGTGRALRRRHALSRDGSAPYRLHWDSTGAAEGPHELVVDARTAGGRRAVQVLPVVVVNGELPPTLEVALAVPD